MRKIEGNYGKCIIDDCRNHEGNKEFELLFCDVPFNIGFKGTEQSKDKADPYKDNRTKKEYEKLLDEMTDTFFPLTKRRVIFPGHMNHTYWYKNHDVVGYCINNKRSAQGATKCSYMNKKDDILCFGNFKSKKFKWNVFNHDVKKGREREIPSNIDIHSCPGNRDLYLDMISQLNPESVVDPMCGTCTVGSVCEELGIPWIAYEIEEKYSPVIKWRIEYGIKQKSKKDVWNVK